MTTEKKPKSGNLREWLSEQAETSQNEQGA